MAIGTGAAILGGALISGVAGKMASDAAGDAAKEQRKGFDASTAESRRQFDITSQNLTDAQEANRRAITAGATASAAEQQQGFRRQQGQLGQFASAGRDALAEQQALLGVGGQEAQQAAFDRFSESPGQRFIRGRAQKSLLRNQAAIGGIGGGNVRSALVEQGAGFAAQDFNNQFNRFGDIRTAGQNAATNIGQGALTTGANIGATKFNAGQAIGSGAINTAARQGQFGQNMANTVGANAVGAGQARATGIQNQSNILQNTIGQFAGAAGQFFNPSAVAPPTTIPRIGVV